MKTILIILIMFLSTPVLADEIQHFNPKIFGKSADNCTFVLSPSSDNAIKPSQIITDINEKGIFYAARLIYPKTVALDEARKSINKLYKIYEVKTFADNPGLGIWRNEDGRFTIQLSTADECNSKLVQVIYIWLDRQELPNHSLLPTRLRRAGERDVGQRR
jgi:hypothetical protein